jgi:PhoH-like ATPase
MPLEKIYVLDTNVLIEDPEVLFRFEQDSIGIPILVLEELDRIKVEQSSRGANARLIARHLDAIRVKYGCLRDGVQLENGTKIQILFDDKCQTLLDIGILSVSITDNRILKMAICLKEKGHHVVFVSKDINARIKADALGLESQDYMRGVVLSDNYYKGWQEFTVTSAELKKQIPDILQDLAAQKALECNEFVVLSSQGNKFNNKMYRFLGGSQFREVALPHISWPITAKNIHQLMALDLLFDPNIVMMSLTGPAGTGKTFLTLFAGLYHILAEESYNKMIIARSVVPLGHDIGYLPGDVQEKLHGWMQPMYDNVDVISHMIAKGHEFDIRGNSNNHDYKKNPKKFGKSRRGKGGFYEDKKEIRSLDQLIDQRKVSLDAITYMRGRSIAQQFIFIDEVQNLTTHEVKTLLSRVGEGSKIVLSGDPYQIDVPYLDFSTNGLVVATDRFKGQSIFGTVFMPTSERSELSRLVHELL